MLGKYNLQTTTNTESAEQCRYLRLIKHFND